MINLLVHRLMEFRDGRNEVCRFRRMEFGWPVGGNTLVQVYEPLARDVITHNQDRYGQAPDGAGEDIIHIGISGRETNIRTTPK